MIKNCKMKARKYVFTIFCKCLFKVVGNIDAEIALKRICIKLLHCTDNSAFYFQVTTFVGLHSLWQNRKLFTKNINNQ